MTPTPWPTDLAILMPAALLLAWLLYDVAVVAWLGPRHGVPTITRRIQSLSAKYPAIPFSAGFLGGILAGHFWGQF